MVWAVVMWPLPRHFSDTVPIADRAAPASPRVVETVAGDHIQLLFHFWLARDTFSGNTPLFTNPYEFNVHPGDTTGKRFQTYYLPFSAVYAIVSPILGHAAGWNAAGLFSILLGLVGGFMLARRLSGSNAAAMVASIAFAALPYRWTSLISGSPTGFAMCLVPWMAYGLDKLVRDASARGAAIAGLAIVLSFCSDLHVFFFSMLAAPAFALSSATLDGFSLFGRLRKTCLAAIPLLLLAALALVLSNIAAAQLGKSTMAEGRSMRELLLFSPVLKGIFLRSRLEGATNSIYLGLATAIFFPFAIASLAIDGRERPRRLGAALLLAGAAFASILLATGAYGPFNALPIRVARAIVPKYSMIRQPAKIFCLLPTIFTAIAALALGGANLMASVRRRRSGTAIAAILTIMATAVLMEQASWFSTVLSRMDTSMPAYETAAGIASDAGMPPSSRKALALPIWPGDSHFSSLYELGIMSSRLCLLNGYSPSPPTGYFENVFKPLESLNQGVMDYQQYLFLKKSGIEFILFHEDVFPDKVSPFPAGVSIAELSSNPALRHISSVGRVSLFRIEDGLAPEDFLNSAKTRMTEDDSTLEFPPSLIWTRRQIARSIETASAPGRINLALRAPIVLRQTSRYVLHSREAGWSAIPLANEMGCECDLPNAGDIDLIFVAAGKEPDDRMEIAPMRLFHCGTSNPADGSVTFKAKPGQAATTPVMEGPFIPIEQGRWRIDVQSSGAAECMARLQAVLGIRGGDSATLAEVPFPANGKASLEFDMPPDAMPFALRVTSNSAVEMRIDAITLTKAR